MDMEIDELIAAGEANVGLFAGLCRWIKALRRKLFARLCRLIKALPRKFAAKVTKVAKSAIKLGKDDPRRVVHSVKVALALTLVSLLYYWRALFDGLGVAGIWAVITVVVVFEFSVGATLSKGLNRGFATLLAGALGLGAQKIAYLFGEKGEPVVLGIFVFLIAATSTFLRFFPWIKARYDYGVLIFILTFSMVAVSGDRVDALMGMAHERLLTILIGGGTCMVISAFVCPVWAGEDLHKLIASNIEKLANYLEGFGGEYFQASKGGNYSMVPKIEESLLQGYKSVLNSKATEESLANFARWEPGHGRFTFRHPWKQYLKIGALLRQCAYQIETLNGHINSDVQVPQEFLHIIQDSCRTMSIESGKALKALAVAIETMNEPNDAYEHLEKSKTAVKELKFALKSESLIKTSDVLVIVPAATVASLLVEIVKGVEKLSKSVCELPELAQFNKYVEPTVSPEKPQLIPHTESVKPVGADHVIITEDELLVKFGPHEKKGPELSGVV